MPSLNKDFLIQLENDYQNYPCFIETGTYDGGTIFAVEPHFNTLYTIEISEYHFQNTKKKYTGNKIHFILGDSSFIFQYLLPTITQKTIFFLDGHYSFGDTGRGKKDCPLLEEIKHIHDLFQPEAILIIDDARLFKKNEPGLDWSEISRKNILDILNSRVERFYSLDSECAKDDRLIVHIKSK